jgi:hypothetical protein
MSPLQPEDRPLVEVFAGLEPPAERVARLQVRVLQGYEARSRSLWREWLSLLRARPLAHGAWALAAVLVVGFSTPLAAVPGALAQALRPQPPPPVAKALPAPSQAPDSLASAAARPTAELGCP